MTNTHDKNIFKPKKPMLWEYNVICDINNINYRNWGAIMGQKFLYITEVRIAISLKQNVTLLFGLMQLQSQKKSPIEHTQKEMRKGTKA